MEIVEFEIEHEGARHSCSFEISGGAIKTLTVTTPFGAVATGMGGLPPETLAREIAEKLARRAGAAESVHRRWPVVT